MVSGGSVVEGCGGEIIDAKKSTRKGETVYRVDTAAGQRCMKGIREREELVVVVLR